MSKGFRIFACNRYHPLRPSELRYDWKELNVSSKIHISFSTVSQSNGQQKLKPIGICKNVIYTNFIVQLGSKGSLERS